MRSVEVQGEPHLQSFTSSITSPCRANRIIWSTLPLGRVLGWVQYTFTEREVGKEMSQPCSATKERGMHKTAQRWRRRRRRRRRDYNHSTGQCYIGHSVDALLGHVQYRIVRRCILHMCTNVSVTPLLKDIRSQSLVAITSTVADIIQM